MIVPVMAISNLVLAQQIYSEGANGAWSRTFKRSVSYRGATAWNQLSNKTREMVDLTSFKLAIS